MILRSFAYWISTAGTIFTYTLYIYISTLIIIFSCSHYHQCVLCQVVDHRGNWSYYILLCGLHVNVKHSRIHERMHVHIAYSQLIGDSSKKQNYNNNNLHAYSHTLIFICECMTQGPNAFMHILIHMRQSMRWVRNSEV